MIDAQYKLTLLKFVNAAKYVIYDPKRADALLKMMQGNGTGALAAVHTVLASIEQNKPIDAKIVPLLSVSILMLLLELMKKAFNKELPPDTLKKLIAQVMLVSTQDHLNNAKQTAQPTQPAPPVQTPAPQAPPQIAPGGIIQGAMA